MIQIEKNTPVMLLILDGFGYSPEKIGNAVAQADMPTWDFLVSRYPHTLLHASGSSVGLPEGFMGNSEVGHLTIGAGRIIQTILSKFHNAIDNGSFFKNNMLINYFENLKKRDKALHLIGLLSDAGVHSHEKHLYALIQLAMNIGLKKVYIHPILDGRDTPPQSASDYLERLESACIEERCGVIASLHGRFYAMDRDNNWERTKKSYDVLVGRTQVEVDSWLEVLDDSYHQNITDEFIEPTLLLEDGIIREGDGVVFFNFRPDRARQLTESFINPEFNHFIVEPVCSSTNKLSFFVTTTRFDDLFTSYKNDVLFEEEKIESTLLDEFAVQKEKLSNNKVFIIAETEKYAHVTYFFRGKFDLQLEHEKRELIPSIKAKNYIEHPKMSAQIITQKIIASLKDDIAGFYLVNYANCDMVGHSGNFDATVKACEYLDVQLKVLYEEVIEKRNGTIFLTADHGNAEEMIDLESGQVKTSHTTNPVPFVMINKKLRGLYSAFDVVTGGLSHIAPTILRYLGLAIPKQMEKKIIHMTK